jgi:hypothetical protein
MQEMEHRLGVLREEHRDLDAAILALMKRRKLRVKDEIQLLESRLVPDIIA